MSALTRVLFPLPVAHHNTGEVFRWWESRRPIYNAFVGGAGLVTLGAVYFMAALPPFGVLLPLFWQGILAYAVLANFCYSFGFAAEAAMRRAWGEQCPPVGPALFRQGVIFSVGLTLLPIVLASLEWIVRVARWILR